MTKNLKKLDHIKTLQKYENRIRPIILKTLTDSDRKRLSGAFLSSYEGYCTITENLENFHRKCNSAVVLMRVLRSIGIPILGVTSERMQHGPYIAADRQKMTRVEYVGKFSYFTGKKSHPWRLLPIDRVFRREYKEQKSPKRRLECLEIPAVDVLQKPSSELSDTTD